jgi:hypothetical protein
MTSDLKRGKQCVVLLLLAFAAAAMAVAAAGVMAGGERDGSMPFPKPGSHKGSWTEYHGRSVAAGGGSIGRPPAACVVCHDRQDCITCHETIKPRDHTNYWRTRGHGLMVASDRARCFSCHRQDYCIRCHSETAPRSHTASWLQRHCTVCHFGPGKTITGGCAVCHTAKVHSP